MRKVERLNVNSVDLDETAHMSRLIWIYAVCKSLLLSPVTVRELTFTTLKANSADDKLVIFFSYFPKKNRV